MASSELLAEIVALADPTGRSEAAARLAWRLGADALIVFLKDQEIGLLLPAPGFIQTLPGGDAWQSFLAECVERSSYTGLLPWPNAEETRSALSIMTSDEVALVLLGGCPHREPLEEVAILLPLLGASLRGEYEARLATVRAATEREAATQAASLVKALDTAHRDLQRAFQEIGALNDRLQRLIVETHHRVKNHLQVLGAMVDIQLMGGDESLPADEFRRIQTYIRTLSDVHDLLTETSKAGHLEEMAAVKPILERLIPTLQKTVNREVRYRCDDVVLPVKKVTSLILLTSELVSNAIKHGEGTIEVSFDVQNLTATLVVEDDGPGFPEDFDPLLAANTGLGLIQSFAEFDLRGHLRFENRTEGGGRVVVTFPLERSPFLES